ncbi:MAG: lipopolysaccharide biosynthesis protein [Phycisphaeraceae bacterium]
MQSSNDPSSAKANVSLDGQSEPDGFVRQAWVSAWRGGWALADHILFAGANFLVQLGLAREWLSEYDFGVFSVAYVSFLILGVFQTALLSEPVALFGAKRYRDNLPNYLSKTIGIHLVISLVGGLLLAGVGVSQLLFGEYTLGVALCALAIAQAFQLLPWTLRIACYLNSDPMHAGVSGLIYLVLVVGLLLGFDELGIMSIPAAVAAMAISSLVVCVYLMYFLRISPRAIFQRAGYAEVLRDHWRYGKWAMPTGVMRWVPEHFPVLAAPLVIGWMASSDPDFESGGALKAMLHLSVPFVLFIAALSTLLVPMLVRRRGTPAFGKLSWQMLGVTFAITLISWPIVGFNHEWIIQKIYNGHFIEHAGLLWIVGLIPVLISIDCLLCAQLHAVERPDRSFYGSIAASAVLIIVGLPMLAIWGLTGILIAMLISYAAQAVVLWLTGGGIIRAACRPENSLASAESGCKLDQADEIHNQTAESEANGNPGYAG